MKVTVVVYVCINHCDTLVLNHSARVKVVFIIRVRPSSAELSKWLNEKNDNESGVNSGGKPHRWRYALKWGALIG